MNKRICCLIIYVLISGLAASSAWSQENQILNPEFDDGLTDWGLYGGAGFTVEVVQGAGLSGKNAALFDITDAAGATSIGIAQGGFLLEQGVTYPIGFTARAEEDREMVVLVQTNINNTSWPDQLLQRVQLTTTPQTFVIEYEHTGNTLGAVETESVNIYLMLKGQWWPMQGNDLNKKVWIDRVFIGAEPPKPSLVLADYPSPSDLSTDVPRTSDLTWRPGIHAATHNVYVGDSFADVNSGTVPTASVVDVNSFDPGRLEFGKTYFWRVDEVNGTPDKTVFTGDIWSFEVEPYSVKLPSNTITVSASSVGDPSSEAERTIDGSGLDDPESMNALHSTQVKDAMWMSASGDMSPWLMYEFDAVQKLDQMLIWNSNHGSETVIGWGIKEVEIETSANGLDWMALPDVGPITRSTGLSPSAAQAIDMGLAQAKYVRLNIQNNWGGILPQYGVAEVQFYAIPTQARTPVPASGSVDVRPDAVVAWRGGREADQHTIYADTDPNAVTGGTATSISSSTNSIGLGSFDLQLGETYYWRVDEVNNAETPSVWPGPVWSLSTSTSLVVEDFESYNNFSPDRPFQTWLDGFGYSEDEFFPVAYEGNGTGSGAGHDIWNIGSPQFEGQIMESGSTVNGSGQSMPFYYSNAGSVASYTERTFAGPQDWTTGGVQTLSIPFRGQKGNTGTLFVKINDTKVTYPHAATNMALVVWQAWNIDLSSMNVQNVTTLQIGVDGSNAAGMILIDDITLHAEAGQVINPADPGTDGLVAKYTFDSDYSDSSGNGHHGTVVGTDGTDIVNDPVRGQVLSLPGFDDQYVEIGAVGISGAMPRTIACWAKAAHTEIPDWSLIFGFTEGSTDGTGVSGSHFNLGSLGGPGGIGAHVWGWEETMVSDQEGLNWHHYAMTYDGTSIAYFLDGIQMDSDTGKSNVFDLSPSGDRVHIGSRITHTNSFPGNVDDAVIYNRALSAGEILSLAGNTAPIDKPF